MEVSVAKLFFFRMNHYALYLSLYHFNTEVQLACLLSGWATTTGRPLGHKCCERLSLDTTSHGHRQRGAEGRPPFWIFMHGTNIVDRGLKVLFSVFFAIFRYFFRYPPPWKFFCRCPCDKLFKNAHSIIFSFCRC